MSARTGAGALVNPDNIAVYRIVIVVLAAAAIGSLVASVDGLLHVASWYMAPHLAWTLPLALDGFMIGTAIATLALRHRHAHAEALILAALTVALVAFSAWANWVQVASTVTGTELHEQAAPWIKAAMPLIVLFSTETIAMLTSIRKQGDRAPLVVARQKLAERSKEVTALKRQLKAVTPPPVPARSVSPWRPDARPTPPAPLALVEQHAAEVMAR